MSHFRDFSIMVVRVNITIVITLVSFLISFKICQLALYLALTY